jgi:hypothetical protein
MTYSTNFSGSSFEGKTISYSRNNAIKTVGQLLIEKGGLQHSVQFIDNRRLAGSEGIVAPIAIAAKVERECSLFFRFCLLINWKGMADDWKKMTNGHTTVYVSTKSIEEAGALSNLGQEERQQALNSNNLNQLIVAVGKNQTQSIAAALEDEGWG